MVKAKCIRKLTDKHNEVYAYRLIDMNGDVRDVYKDPLKQAIKNKQITVVNLTLTSDGRLIYTTEKQPKIPEEQQFKGLIAKAKLLGIQMDMNIPTACSHICNLISKSDTQHIIYIPDDVIQLNHDDYDHLTFTEHIKNLQGSIKVLGGHNLKDTNNMFSRCKAKYLDLSSLDVSKVINMKNMFIGCDALFIDMSSFNISIETNLDHIFDFCRATIESTDPWLNTMYSHRKGREYFTCI